MSARFFSWNVGAMMVLAIAALPAAAADDIETKAQLCAACHGEKGTPTDPKTVPIIWGQQQSYIVKQLHDYRSGDRASPIMGPIAKSLDQGDLRKLAAYFAAKQWPAAGASSAAAAAPAAAPAAKVVKASAASPAVPKQMAQCQLCHQPKFEGGMPAPRLAGLSYDYLATEMSRFARDERTNNLDMPKFMRALSAKDREAMARYLASVK